LLFSSFTTPILSSIFTIIIYLIGHVLWTFNEFKHRLVEPITNFFSHFIYYILPNLEKFNIKNQIVVNTEIKPFFIYSAILYALLYITALLILTILIFQKRDFQ
jgi:hypothetical protein